MKHRRFSIMVQSMTLLLEYHFIVKVLANVSEGQYACIGINIWMIAKSLIKQRFLKKKNFITS